MEALTISEAFRKCIGSKIVQHAFFSTFSFEPDFFELEVIPLLLDNPALSSNEALRYFEIQNLMRDSHDRFAVAYDVDIFDPALAPRLEVNYLPIRVGGACQHAKIAVLALKDKQDVPSILLVAGSFNLTKAGWLESIEVGHWVELTEDYAPSNICAPLLDALKYFNKKQNSNVLSALITKVSKLGETGQDPSCSFYFSETKVGKNKADFPAFIKKNVSAFDQLEIISPFFAKSISEDSTGDSKNLANFLKLFNKVKVLLPLDVKGLATVPELVYRDLDHLKVKWSNWTPDFDKSHGIPKQSGQFRNLHAKIYQCIAKNRSESWIFLGSVNLSYKAFFGNVEAGFLLKGVGIRSLLSEITENVEPNFATNLEPEALKIENSISMPVIQLVYDWDNHSLQLTCSETGRLRIIDHDSCELLSEEMTQDQTKTLTLAAIETQLQRSSLFKVNWQVASEQSVYRNILISQRNIYRRPSDSFLAMPLKDLLNIFQDMSTARRNELLTEYAAQQIRLQQGGLVDEFLPILFESDVRGNFFSEFSQVNGAFWSLGKQLEKYANCSESKSQLKYYMEGCQPDSLRGVLKALQSPEKESSPSIIVSYLTLLSMSELLQKYASLKVNELASEVETEIANLEKSEEMSKIPNSKEFLEWVKQKFKQPIRDIIRANHSVELNNAGN